MFRLNIKQQENTAFLFCAPNTLSCSHPREQSKWEPFSLNLMLVLGGRAKDEDLKIRHDVLTSLHRVYVLLTTYILATQIPYRYLQSWNT